jgi:hypothetical protein
VICLTDARAKSTVRKRVARKHSNAALLITTATVDENRLGAPPDHSQHRCRIYPPISKTTVKP